MAKTSSTTQRILSGSIASWVGILVTIGSQILLVPLFLSVWDAATYGVWLVLLAMTGVLTLLTLSFHDYIGFECLQLGDDKHKVNQLISSSFPVAVLIGFLIVAVAGLLYGLEIGQYLNLTQQQNDLFTLALLINVAFWGLTSNISGFIERWLIPFGYYPFFAWVRVVRALINAIAPALVAWFGGDLVDAVIAMGIADLMFHFWLYVYLYRECRSNDFLLVKGYPLSILGHWYRSFGLLLRYLIDMVRQMGIRVVLAPFLTPAQIANFATTRTGANLAFQGMNSIAGAALPELMRFVRDNESGKLESLFAGFWFVVLLLLLPGLYIAQMIMPTVFEVWTLGKMEFNGLLFATLSISIVLYAIAQPAESILRGLNKVKEQIVISFIASGIAILGSVFFVPTYGLVAAGFSLLVAELVAMGLYSYAAREWLISRSMIWPAKQFILVLLAGVWNSMAIVYLANQDHLFWVLFGLMVQIVFVIAFWKMIPELAKDKLRNRIGCRLKLRI